MKKRTAVIGALASLLPIGQPLVIGTGAVLTSAGVILTVPEKAQAERGLDYFQRGLDTYDAADYYGAISYFSKAIGSNELSTYNLAGAYYNRGKAKSDLKYYRGALSDFNNAIEINPNKPDYYIFRGNTKRRLNKDQYGAISDYNIAIKINPNNSLAYSNRGAAKEKIGDMKGACADWREASYLGNQDAAKWVRNQC